MFYFLNQGMVMRFMSARSVQDGRRAMFAVALVLMPLAACVVASGGWVAKALSRAGVLPPDLEPGEAFFVATEFLSTPGVFGLILAAMTAALMSTVDTLITAVSAVVVNDVYKPLRPGTPDRKLLRVARISAVSVTLVGVVLVPVFQQFKTIYEAHGAMTAAVTPPLVVALLLAVFWRRFTGPAALATVVGGTLAIALSIFVPEVIAPFSYGVPAGERAEGLLGGMTQYKFMRACYGITVSLVIAFVVTLFTKPRPFESQRGLVWGTTGDALEQYKGSKGSEYQSRRAMAAVRPLDREPPVHDELELPIVTLSKTLADELEAGVGSMVYITDPRWWTGGVRSSHAIVGDVTRGEGKPIVWMGPQTFATVVSPRRAEKPVRVHRLY